MENYNKLSTSHTSVNTKRQALEEFTTHFNNQVSRGLRQAPANISIPVVVHIVYNTNEQNLVDAFVYTQIQVLNEGK